MQFSLTSLRDADPPEFTLRFNVSFGPPTLIKCAVDESDLNISDKDMTREVVKTYFNDTTDPDMTRVHVTVRQRIAGRYACTVSVGIANHALNYSYIGTGIARANITGVCSAKQIVFNVFVVEDYHTLPFSCRHPHCCHCFQDYPHQCPGLLDCPITSTRWL